jgi:hypothetical protein
MNTTLLPIRVQLSRKKGWKMPPNTIKVARPTKWGNPFKIGDNHPLHGWPMSRLETVELFADDIISSNPRVGFNVEEIEQLRGKNLACFCRIDEPCHAEILLWWANKRIKKS